MKLYLNFSKLLFSQVLFIACSSLIVAQDTIYISKDTTMWTTSTKVNFIANSIVETNNNGKVISGFITKSQYLWTAERLVKFAKGSEVKFNDDGNVFSGVLAENTYLRSTIGFILFRSNSLILLNNKGKVIEGFLLKNIPTKVQSKTIFLKAGSFIKLDKTGHLLYGTVSERCNLKCNDNKNRTFKVGNTIELNDEYKVIVNNNTLLNNQHN